MSCMACRLCFDVVTWVMLSPLACVFVSASVDGSLGYVFSFLFYSSLIKEISFFILLCLFVFFFFV